MNKFIMLVGLPGCGKTTWAKTNIDDDFNWISSDSIRYELFGDKEVMEFNNIVFKTMFDRTCKSLKSGKNVIYDATNLSEKKRTNLLKNIKDNIKIDFEKVAVVFTTPFEECIKRQEGRGRIIPYGVMKRMIMAYQVPYWNEGWDKIEIVREIVNKSYLEKPKSIIEYQHFLRNNGFSDCIGYNQNNPYHLETLDVHMYETYLKAKDDAFRYVYCMLHDIGKPFCEKRDDYGVSHFSGHANVSAYMTLECLSRYKYLENSYILNIAKIIELHMNMFTWSKENYNKCEEKFKNKYGLNIYNDVVELHKYDIESCVSE